jgi:hypothetical protein
VSDLDFLDDVLPAPSSGKKKKFATGMDSVPVADTMKATGKGKQIVGGRKRKTIFLPPDVINKLDTEAKRLKMAKMDWYEWLVAQGWKAYQNGARPEYEEVPTKKSVKPPW